MRVILPVLALIVAPLVLIVPALLSGGLVAVLEIGIHAALGNATGAAAAAGIFIEVLIGLSAFGVALFVGLCVGGPLRTAMREYALLFYGGRHPRLGDILSHLSADGPHAPGVA
jgi:hypothetical protein